MENVTEIGLSIQTSLNAMTKMKKKIKSIHTIHINYYK